MCLKILRMISIGTTSIMRRKIVSEYLSPPQLRPTLILMVALRTGTFAIKDIIFGLIVVQKSKKDIFFIESEIVFIEWMKKRIKKLVWLGQNLCKPEHLSFQARISQVDTNMDSAHITKCGCTSQLMSFKHTSASHALLIFSLKIKRWYTLVVVWDVQTKVFAIRVGADEKFIISFSCSTLTVSEFSKTFF